MKAISIRQPWAWLIVNGYKDIENRSWDTKYRGLVLIHAAKTKPTIDEWYEAERIAHTAGVPYMPPFESMDKGGIVGYAYITDTTRESVSPWFFGPVGFNLTGAKKLPFQSLKGRLSFFESGYSIIAAGKQEALVKEIICSSLEE